MKTKAILTLATALLISCGEKQESASTPPNEPSTELLAIFEKPVTGEASLIHLARATAKPGDTIVLKGQVMGASEPFVEGRAAFILGDRSLLTPCNERPGDACETPWDTCCDSKEAFREGIVTIQILGENGRPLKQELEGVAGMEKLAPLLVSGEVDKISGPGNLVVNAKAIQVLETVKN